ncbi:permease [Alkalicoccus luteus]|uniref:permease n=1 Tax=Alkalicoccus luteus TaxID=1237094 RepID=UPI00403464F8
MVNQPRIRPDILGGAVLLFILILFLFQDVLTLETAPSAWINVNTIFLGIVIEAAPFLLIGVLLSSMIHLYVTPEQIARWMPGKGIKTLVPAALVGTILPLCECAIVPVVRRLIKKGVPFQAGMVFLVAAPILNPVVLASTFFAFRNQLEIVYVRFGLAFVLSLVIGLILYLVFKNKGPVIRTRPGEVHVHHHHEHGRGMAARLKEICSHAAEEFFMMGKYLLIGAFIAALFQTFLDRSVLLSVGSDEIASVAVMMAFAYILSLCSEADAFVASSFGNQFTPASISAFLLYGPMLDLKNTIMLFAFFRTKFVIVFIINVTAAVFAGVLLTFAVIG